MTHVRTARRMAALIAATLLAGLTVVGGVGPATPAGAGSPAPADSLRINQIQSVGSHNSYHLAASAAETALRRAVIGSADDQMQYAHAPLGTQFGDQKVRQIELDVFRDDAGGKYASPFIREAAGHGAYGGMGQPGTKVLHIQDVDYRSNCLTLVACLQAVETWSDANPDHLPIAILMELKDDRLDIGGFDFTVPDPWTASAMNALDAEIRTVMSPTDMITPDDVRGGATTLEQAVLSTGWPTLGASRGKVMFLMDNGGGYRTSYLQGHPNLEGRVMFTNATPGQPDAAFVKENDSLATARIQDLVADGYMVRTRSDADTLDARAGDTTHRDAAFASGAQWVSTDYPVSEYAQPYGTGFVVEVPGGTIARCNPVNGPVGCVSGDIEPFPTLPEGPYVRRLFEAAVGRQPSNSEEWFWARRLAKGTPRNSVVRSILFSREANRGPFTAEPYTTYLDRAIDDVTYWGTYLDTRPREHYVVSLLASPEFYAKGGGSDAGFVTRLYDKVLHRAPDQDGLDYFVGELAAGRNRWTVARRFYGAIESRRARVDALYQSILGRAPSAEERDGRVERLRLTRDDRDTAQSIYVTAEFHGMP